jgi:hypothetical protein
MENKKLTMCDYINSSHFMHIEEYGALYKITMKSMVFTDAAGKPYFTTLDNNKIDTFKYSIYFANNTSSNVVDPDNA